MKKLTKHRTHDVSFLSRMPAGIPGDISRKEGAVVEARVFDTTNPPLAYGQPAVIDGTSFNMRKVLPGDLGAAIYGIFARPYPTSNLNTTDGLGVSTPNTSFPANIVRKAYMTVLMQNTTAAVFGGPVYVRTAATSGGLVQGGYEAAFASAGTAAAKSGGNTGNGVISAITTKAGTVSGIYKVRASSAGTNAADFDLFDPSGNLIEQQGYASSGGVATFVGPQMAFTITDGSTDFIVGDGFDITVVATNIMVPSAIFTGPADASGNVEISYKM